MLKIIYILFSLLVATNLYAVNIDKYSTNIDILSKSKIYISNDLSSNKNVIKNKNFKENQKTILGFGFMPEKALWIKFSLKNTSNKVIEKTIVYENPETENIRFYDGEKTTLDGMWNMPITRETIYPTFKITLKPQEEREFYIRAYSKITTLIAKVKLYDNKDALKKDYQHKTFLFMFFASISILLIYNTMLLLFTKDRAYFYYTIYLIAVILFESIYLGVSQLYFLSNEISEVMTKATITYISMLVIPIVLFTQEFLDTSRFKTHNKIFKTYLYMIPFLCILSYDDMVLDQNIMLIFIPLGFALISVSIIALFRGVRQAKFYVLGWSVVIISLLLSVIESYGYINISTNITYMNEFAFTLEALLFSIALAHRIKILNEEKNILDAKLIAIQKDEKQKLQELVDEKTKNLKDSLDEKELLYRELNHRVKNNLAMTLSLIKLQISKSKDINTKYELSTTQNRISSIANLYENLNISKVASSESTQEYFHNIEHNIRLNFDKNISVQYDINTNLDSQKLIYCGLILNELLTNSFKYAFNDQQEGHITISLTKEDSFFILKVADNGSGFKYEQKDSLGLTIVKTLAEKQLFGTMNINSDNGTEVIIKWED
ncbi:7TM diverse intracellular signaling domain-containing protein [Sulfurimonas sp.]|uniref:7TM diverse intracellular signaling domain-containing protein n=1 Tax=Sulfurimonas sp. TaxID=2022749 RepID=UPI0035657170